jgi:hypothetical protein
VCEILTQLPPGLSEHLGYYVYLYVDPRSGRPFYVGKGRGSRVLAHLSDVGDSGKVRLIREIRASGHEPELEILAHGLPDEGIALKIEAAVMQALGVDDLTNIVAASCNRTVRRQTLGDLAAFYATQPRVVRPKLVTLPQQLASVLGSVSAAQVLMFLQARGSGHALRISQTFGVAVSPIQRQLGRLQSEGILMSRTAGKTRLYEFNPNSRTALNLRPFLQAEMECLPDQVRLALVGSTDD